MKKYRPSNGSEWCWFESEYCDKCAQEKWNPETDKGRKCGILNKAFLEKEPKEWVYGDDDKPTCTAFKLPEPYKKPEPKIPGQITF